MDSPTLQLHYESKQTRFKAADEGLGSLAATLDKLPDHASFA